MSRRNCQNPANMLDSPKNLAPAIFAICLLDTKVPFDGILELLKDNRTWCPLFLFVFWFPLQFLGNEPSLFVPVFYT